MPDNSATCNGKESTGYTQKNGAVSKGNKEFTYFSLYTGTTYTFSSGNCPRFSCATSSSLLMLNAGPRGHFQDGVAAGKGFLCAPFWGVQICDYSAAWVSCTVITDLDTSKRSTQKAFFLLRRHLGNWPRGPALSMRSELLVAHEKRGQLPLLKVYVVPV